MATHKTPPHARRPRARRPGLASRARRARWVLALALLTATSALPGCDAADAGIPQAAPADTLDGASIDLGHTMGDPNAPIAVVEFSDFGCPYCARFARATLPGIQQEFINAGLVRWRYIPVSFGFPGGELMGAAAECAASQGGRSVFWRVHDLFYERQVALRGDDARPRLLTWLDEELGLDPVALEACIDSPATRTLLERHNTAAQQWYVRGTPTFVINGVPMAGAAPLDFFRQVFGTALDPSGM